MNNKNVLRSTALLTMSGIAAKTIDFIFRAYYSRQLGTEGLGIFSLCFAVHGIMLNIATGGLGVAVSKIISEKYSQRRFGEIKKTMTIALTTVFSLSIAVILISCLLSTQIAEFFLKEPRAAVSLMCISPSILFMGISYCIKGYFYASRRIMPPASSEFLEQAVKIISITYLLPKMLPMGVEHGCEAVFLGFSIGEFSSCLYLSLFYAVDSRRLKAEKETKFFSLVSPMLKIALPLTLNSLLNSFLRMHEEVLIVASLQKSGLEHSAALSLYGGLHGMVMPLIVFPLTLLSSCFTMLVPEISRAYARESSIRLKTLVSRIYRFCTFFGFLVMTVIVTFSKELSVLVYNAPEISHYLKILALLTPFMFMDSVSCGILNGMGKQGTLLTYSLTDSLLRIGLILAIVSRYGIGAFVFIIITSNLFTVILTVRKVLKVSGLHFEWFGWLLKHIIPATVAWFVSGGLILNFMQGGTFEVASGMVITAFIYFATDAALSSTLRSDAAWLVGRMFFAS